MRASAISSTALATILFGLTCQATDCNANNCLRAVRRASNEANGLADCQSYLATTVVPATATHTVTITVPGRLRRQQGSGTTVTPTAQPTYASACSTAGAYKSACLCIGATTTIITGSAPSTTITVTQTASTSSNPSSTTPSSSSSTTTSSDSSSLSSSSSDSSSSSSSPSSDSSTFSTSSTSSSSQTQTTTSTTSCPVCSPSTVTTTLPSSTSTCYPVTVTVTGPESSSSTTGFSNSTSGCVPSTSVSTLTITANITQPPITSTTTVTTATVITQTVTTSAPCVPPPPPRPCPSLNDGNFFLRFGESNNFLDGEGNSAAGRIVFGYPGHLWRFENSAAPYRLQYIGLPNFPTFGAAGTWLYMEAATGILKLASLASATSMVAAGTAHWPVCQYNAGVVSCNVGLRNTIYQCPNTPGQTGFTPILQTPTYAAAGCVQREAMVAYCRSTP